MARNSSARRGTPACRSSRPHRRSVRCAIYTRKSTEEGLEQEFNSLDAQREAAEAYIASQKHEGWQVLPTATTTAATPAATWTGRHCSGSWPTSRRRSIDCVVVYKVDRLSRSLLDFARIMEVFDKHGVSFVSVTQQFNTTTSMGRLMLNVLLSFAQFEREIISERTRDKMSAARRKGKWIGGHPVLGYDIDPKGGRIIVNPDEAEQVRTIFDLYLKLDRSRPVWEELQRRGLVTKRWTTEDGVTGRQADHQEGAPRDPDQRPLHRHG